MEVIHTARCGVSVQDSRAVRVDPPPLVSKLEALVLGFFYGCFIT